MAYLAEDGLGLGAKILVALGTAGSGLAMAYWVFLLERRSPRMPTIVAVEEDEDVSAPEDIEEDSELREEDEGPGQ